MTRREMVRSYNHGDYGVIDDLLMAAMIQKRVVQVDKGRFAAAVSVGASVEPALSHFGGGVAAA